MQDMTALHTLVINSLEEQIAVIDQAGTIIDVNHSWNNFGMDNGISSKYSWVGCNYLKVLSASAANGDCLAAEAEQGILDVVQGKCASFYLEYPCHSPEEKRWFMMRVIPVKRASKSLFVISHTNITLRKLAEERAEHLSMHDPLTGLANRRYFYQSLSKETRRSIRNRSTISLIALDVDYFKSYNDALGHPAGDQCLANVSQVLRVFSQRPSDLAARLGGDEFALLLADADFVESQTVAEAIIKKITDLNMVFGESKLVTVSIGVVTAIPHDQKNEDFLLQEVDKALYRAKLEGRNRVVRAQFVVEKPA